MVYNRTNRWIFLFLALLIILVAIVFLGTEIFLVDKITVMGSKTIDDSVIIGLSGVPYGENIFKINKSSVKNRLESNPPFVILSSVSLKLPNQVVITVEERTPAAVIPYLSSFIVIDSNGFILDIIKQRSVTELPIIRGVRIKSLAKGRQLEITDSDTYRQRILYRLLEAVDAHDVAGIISDIDLEDPDYIKFETIHGIDIIIGQAIELDKKLSWLLSEAYDMITSEYDSGTFDISVKKPRFIIPVNEVEVED